MDNEEPQADKVAARARKYAAFISHRHNPDAPLAEVLQSALHRMGTPWYRRWNRRIFRDRTDLATGASLAGEIHTALRESDHFILLACPELVASQWCRKELDYWVKERSLETLHLVLTAGQIEWDEAAGDFDWAKTTALPDNLRGVFNQIPLYLDLTKTRDRLVKENLRPSLSDPELYDTAASLTAEIAGLDKAEIVSEDVRQQRKRLRLARTAVATLTLLLIAAVGAALVAYRQRSIAQENERNARRLLYASDMNLAQRAFESGNVGLGRGLLESYLAANLAGQEDPRGFEWYYLWRLYHGQLAAFNETDDIAFSRDGAVFATATAGELKIWDAASLREKANFKLSFPQAVANSSAAAGDVFRSIAFASDGRTLAYADNERVLLLDISSGSSREVPVPGAGQGQAEIPNQEDWASVRGGIPRFSPDGKLLAISYGCGLVAVYDAQSLREISRLGNGTQASDCASFVAFSPDSRVLAYGDGYNVRLWDTVAGSDQGEPEMDVSLPESVDQVLTAAFSPDGKILAIGDRSKQVVLWNIATRRVLARLKGHEGWVSALAFSSDGKTLYSGSSDQTVKLWDFSSYKGDGQLSGERVKAFATLKGHTGYIRSISCLPAGRIAATVGTDRTVKLWGETAGRDFDTVEGVDEVSPGADLIAKITNDDTRQATTLYDLRDGKPTKLWTVNGSINAALAPGGKTLATYIYDWSRKDASTIKLWDVSSRQALVTLRAQTYDRSRAFSPDGRLFTALSPDGKSVILWDTVERKELTPVTNDAALKDYLLSKTGQLIVALDKDSPRVRSWSGTPLRQSAVFERKAKRPARAEDEEPPLLLALSPDGRFLALSDSEKVELWETGSTQEPILLGEHEADVSALTFSPDGRLIATGDAAGVVKVWDAATRAELASFKGHKDAVMALAFSPDGRLLASGGGDRDGAVKLYGLVSRRELITLTHEPSPTSEVHATQGGEDAVVELFFSAEGRSLITHSGNGILRIWRGAKDASATAGGQ